MAETTMLALWSAFFTMAAASAATLTGLMFVVISLITQANRPTGTSDGFGTFSTPTVLHFGAALLVAALMCVPWTSLTGPSVLIGLAGLYGVVHMTRVTERIRRLTSYVPDTEDWIWFTILPFLAYVAVLVGAIALPFAARGAIFTLAGSVLLLIFIGIRNAWDVVTYLTLYMNEQPPSSN